MKIIPPGISFEKAVRSGMTGRIEFPGYLAWLRTLPCDTCGRPAPSEASHVNGFKGMGTKGPDPFSIPECTACNQNYDRNPPEVDSRIRRAAFYLLRAIVEGHLVWKKNPEDLVTVPRHMLETLAKAIDFHGGHGEPTIGRAEAAILAADAKRFLA